MSKSENDSSENSTKRVNISMTPEFHDRITEYVEEERGSGLSQFLRASAIQVMKEEEKQSTNNPMQTLSRKERKKLQLLPKIEKNQEKMLEVLDVMEEQGSVPHAKNQQIEDDVYGHLKDTDEAVTVPEIAENIDSSVSNVRKAIEDLDDQHVLEKITDRGSDLARWKVK